jgi:hypothetical protein
MDPNLRKRKRAVHNLIYPTLRSEYGGYDTASGQEYYEDPELEDPSSGDDLESRVLDQFIRNHVSRN